jgi:hypothetical protein
MTDTLVGSIDGVSMRLGMVNDLEMHRNIFNVVALIQCAISKKDVLLILTVFVEF